MGDGSSDCRIRNKTAAKAHSTCTAARNIRPLLSGHRPLAETLTNSSAVGTATRSAYAFPPLPKYAMLKRKNGPAHRFRL
jgi:hypothetical protein